MVDFAAFRSTIPTGRPGASSFVPDMVRKLLHRAESGQLVPLFDNPSDVALLRPQDETTFSLFAPNAKIKMPLTVTRTMHDAMGNASSTTYQDLGATYRDTGLYVAKNHVHPFYTETDQGLVHVGDVHANVVEGNIPEMPKNIRRYRDGAGIALNDPPIGWTFSRQFEDVDEETLAPKLGLAVEDLAGVDPKTTIVIANPFVKLPGQYL